MNSEQCKCSFYILISSNTRRHAYVSFVKTAAIHISLSRERGTKIIWLPIRSQYAVGDHEIRIVSDSPVLVQSRQYRLKELLLACFIPVSLKFRDPDMPALGGEDEITDVTIEGANVILDAAATPRTAVPVTRDEVARRDISGHSFLIQ